MICQWRRQINYLPKPKAGANKSIREILAKPRYFAITEFNNCFSLSFDHQVCFLMNISSGSEAICHYSRKSDCKKEKSVISFTHVQNTIYSQTQLDDIAHEKTIICRQLFAGHVVGFRPMNLHRMMIKDHLIFPLLIISLTL